MIRESRLFAIAAGAVLGYVVLRAALVPVIHDEARTYQSFVATGEFLPYRAAWDAGNHLLVTALAQLSEAFAGPDLFALRIWSVCGFALYAWYAWRIGANVGLRLVRWCLWLALLCTPFLLDFFSLFRGYGLAMGFLMMSVHHLVAFVRARGTRDLAAALIAIALATLGSLSMWLVWCAIWAGCSALVLWRPTERGSRMKQFAVLALTFVPLVLTAWHSGKLSTFGALYFGSKEGLFHGTLRSLTHVVLGSTAPVVVWCVLALLVLIVAAAGTGLKRMLADHTSSLLVLCVTLLLADLAGRVILGAGFGVLYPTDRTALHLVPLFLIALASSIDRIAPRLPVARYGATLLLLLPARTIATANLDRTVYWSEQAIPKAFYRIASERQRALGRPLMIGAYHQMPSCWRFTSTAEGLGLNELDPTDFPQASCDLLMIDTAFKRPPGGFRTIARAATGSNNLMERIDPMHVELLSDSTFEVASTDAEFVGLWEPDPRAFAGRQAIIEWSGSAIGESSVGLVVVLEVSDAHGVHMLYRTIEVPTSPEGTPAHMGLRLPALATSDGRITCYLYNPRKRIFAIDHVRVRIHGIEH